MELTTQEIRSLAEMIVAKLGKGKTVKVDFDPNGDIIIDVKEEEKNPLPDKAVRHKTKLLEDEDNINEIIELAIAEWVMKMKIKLGEITWSSTTLS